MPTNTDSHKEETNEEEIDDSDVSVDDSVLDELSEDDSSEEEEENDKSDAEGFGAIDEEAEIKKADKVENGEEVFVSGQQGEDFTAFPGT